VVNKMFFVVSQKAKNISVKVYEGDELCVYSNHQNDPLFQLYINAALRATVYLSDLHKDFPFFSLQINPTEDMLMAQFEEGVEMLTKHIENYVRKYLKEPE
jgi:hypothetical protein